MLLPLDIQEKIIPILDLLDKEPLKFVRPMQRRALYSAFGSGSSTQGQKALVLLQIITAYHVLPIWQNDVVDTPFPPNWIWGSTLTDKNLPRNALQLADSIVVQNNPSETLTFQLKAVIADLDFAEIHCLLSESVFASAASAVSALDIAVNGFDLWKEWTLNDDDTDDDLPMWDNDSALWAAIAIAGRIMDENSDSQKRYTFWKWWLTEAIPQAWAMIDPPQ